MREIEGIVPYAVMESGAYVKNQKSTNWPPTAYGKLRRRRDLCHISEW